MNASSHRRGIAVLLANEALTWGGFYMLVPLLSVHLTRDAGYSGAVAGAVLAVRQFTQQGLMLFGGVLADRVGYRPVIAAGMLVRALGFAGFALSDRLPVVLLAAVVAALGGALFEATGKAALASLAPPAGRPRLFSLSATMGSLGVTVGPLVGSALLPLSFAAVGLAAGGFFFVAFLLSLALLPPLGAPAAAAPSLAATLKGVARDRMFLAFTALLAGYWFLHNQIYISVPLWATRQTGRPEIVGVLNAVFAVASAILQFPLVRFATRRLPAGAVAATGVATMGLGLALFGAGMAGGVPVFVAAIVVFAAGRALVEPTKDVLTATLAPPEGLAVYFGVAFLALAVGGSAGNLAGGWLYDLATGSGAYLLPWAVFLLVGLVVAACLLVFNRRQAHTAAASSG